MVISIEELEHDVHAVLNLLKHEEVYVMKDGSIVAKLIHPHDPIEWDHESKEARLERVLNY